MAVNINNEINQIETALTKLIQNEIKKQGLVKTGRLLNSVKWEGKQVGDDFQFKMISEDYYEQLDKKHNITKNAFATNDYKDIQKRISNLYNLMIIAILTN